LLHVDLVILAVVAVSIAVAPREQAIYGKWVDLFDGQTLHGWVPHILNQTAGRDRYNLFRFEKGVLQVRPRSDDDIGYLFFHGNESKYRLHFEYRFVPPNPDINSTFNKNRLYNGGFWIHGQSPDSMSDGQLFPLGFKVMLQATMDTDVLCLPTANVCSTGTSMRLADGQRSAVLCERSKSKCYAADDGWHAVDVEVNGSESVRYRVDGHPVLEYFNLTLDDCAAPEGVCERKWKDTSWTRNNCTTGSPLSNGTISIQTEGGHPADYRHVALQRLKE